jgi:hypothetical protein
MSSPMLLSELNQAFGLHDLFTDIFSVPRLDERGDGNAIQEYLREKSGQRTVPNVFVSEYTFTVFLSTDTHCSF